MCESDPSRARIVPKAHASKLITNGNGEVIGIEYTKKGETFTEMGPVIICTGGFGADFSDNSLLQEVEEEWRGLNAWNPVRDLPALRDLPTTNGEHCTGDGIKMAIELGAGTVDMEAVQVHPTGLVDPREPTAKVRFLAAEALRGAGGLLLDADGNRFCDELGKRDYVSGRMWNSKGPFRLVLNSKAAKSIEWHCKHYASRGLMKHFTSGDALAAEIGCAPSTIASTFATYNGNAANKDCPHGKKFFNALPMETNDEFYVAVVGPVVHYTMGGIEADGRGQIIGKQGLIGGLYCGGEVMGGIHGKNRLGGSSLLDCVVYGRVSGASATQCLLERTLSGMKDGSLAAAGGAGAPGNLNIEVTPGADNSVNLNLSWGGAGGAGGAGSATVQTATVAEPAAAAAAAPVVAAAAAMKEYTWAEIEKHTTEGDCWVVIRGEVFDVTEFLPDHPGGKRAPLIYAGKDATEEFDMLHKPELLEKYASEYKIGTVKGSSPNARKSVSPSSVSATEDLPMMTKEEIATHNTKGDCWMIISDVVYNLTDFLADHPGGVKAPLMYAGKDATEEFEMLHNSKVLKKYAQEFRVGRLVKAKL